MKSFWRLSAAAGLALGAAGCAGPADEENAAQEQTESAAAATDGRGASGYHVILLNSLGGNRSIGNSINNLGWITGTSRLTGNQTIHATLWLFGLKLDLGTLGGPNSGVIWPVKNTRGIISGIAETADLDPYNEAWSCSAFFPAIDPPPPRHVCRGFVWEWGEMRPLPTFGGTHGFATGTNNLGQTVGWAENTVEDTKCNPPQRFQFRAAIWGPGNQMQELLPLPGVEDTVSAATAINDLGQVVGISGICSNAVGEYSARHAVMWENGTPTDLGDIGGVAWNTPMAINRRGDVVGFGNEANTVPANDFNVHAFVKLKGQRMRDLGTLPDDPPDATSQALGINERGQVVGVSCGAACRAFIAEKNGDMTDLNGLVVSGSRETLRVAGDINDFGVITGQTQNANGERQTFIALPVRR